MSDANCKRLPKELYEDSNASQHYFKEFGRIRLLTLSPGGVPASCLVEYETSEEARRALHESGFYKGKTFIVQSGSSVEREKNRADPSVLAELDIMSGTAANRQVASRQPAVPSLNAFLKPASLPSQRPQLPLFQMGGPPKKSSEAMPPPAAPVAPPKSPVLIHKMTVHELQKLIASPAFSVEQKFRVLDARDKLHRLHLAQTRDLKQAKTTKGVCPDMCPEKERLMRETKHQVASFETVAGSRQQIDHHRAVKQYSRSSADQEMPLPRELRPEPVLRMTMMYLLHEIADLCDTSNVGVSDWFHFLWDRTRSIRKDIAQQELCCQGSVRLVEQCARFHIHCAGRLVAEELQVFDQKINTENLTKCLQSLKYMYHDLRLKGEQCPNEPEFRAYIILLNLQDSNFLWEVKQLPVRIQQSSEVRFGIEVFKALEQNNYVKFFKLVRRTTYMNACILLRYFNQVRQRALATIVKAYTVKQGLPLPLSSLSYSLAFEDTQQAAQFFEYYGLACDEGEDRVMVDRGTFYFPDLPFLMDRAVNVVEQKRFVSVGAAIAGGEDCLPDKSIYQDHVPENSFDARGFLKTSDADEVNVSVEEEEEEGEIGQDVEVEEDYNDRQDENEEEYLDEQEDQQDEEMDRYQEDEMDDEDNQDYDQDDDDDRDYDNDQDEEEDQDTERDAVDADSLLFKKPSPSLHKVSTSGGFKFPSTPLTSKPSMVPTLPALPSSGFSFAQIMSNGAASPTRKSPQKNVFQTPPPAVGFSFSQALQVDARKPPTTPVQIKPKTPEIAQMTETEKAADELQRRADVLLLAGPQSDSLMRKVCSEEIIRISQQELTDYRRKQERCRGFADEISAEVVQEMLLDVAREESLEYHVGIYARQKTLKRLFAGWRTRVRASKAARERTQMAPLWMPSVPMEEQRQELKSNHQGGTLNDLDRYRQGQAKGVNWKSTGPAGVTTEQVDLGQMVATGIGHRFAQHNRLFFNVVVSVPSEAEEGIFGCSSYLQKFLRTNIKGATNDKESKEPLFVQQVKVNNFQSVGVLVHLLVGEQLRKENGQVLKESSENLDGILFYVADMEKGRGGASADKERLKRQRFRELLRRYKRKGVPLVVFNVVTKGKGQEVDEEEIMRNLGDLEDEARIGSVLVDPMTEKRYLSESLTEGLTFLVENYAEPHPTLRSMSFINLIGGTVGETLWMRLAINATVNAATAGLVKQSQAVAEIYNEAVERLVGICCGRDYEAECVEVGKEMRERFLKDEQRQGESIAMSYCDFPEDWRDRKRQEMIRRFLRSLKVEQFPNVVIGGRGGMGFDEAGLRALKEYLDRVFGGPSTVLYQMIQCLEEGGGEGQWLRPFQVLTQQLLMHRFGQDGGVGPNLVVVYDEDQLKSFQEAPWWLQSIVLKRRIEIEEPRVEEDIQKKRRRISSDIVTIDSVSLDDILRRADQCVERAERITKSFKRNRDALETISSKYDDRLSQLMMTTCSSRSRAGSMQGDEE